MLLSSSSIMLSLSLLLGSLSWITGGIKPWGIFSSVACVGVVVGVEIEVGGGREGTFILLILFITVERSGYWFVADNGDDEDELRIIGPFGEGLVVA